MSRQEGANLREALRACLAELLAAAGRIEALAAESRPARVEALLARLRELAGDPALDEARLHQEVVRLVERSQEKAAREAEAAEPAAAGDTPKATTGSAE